MTKEEKLASVALGVTTWDDFVKSQAGKKTTDYHRGYQDGLAFAEKMFNEIYCKNVETEDEECTCGECDECLEFQKHEQEKLEEMWDLQNAQ